MADAVSMGSDLVLAYREYIGCLNLRAWDNLGRFVHDDVQHNDKALGLAGYRAMLEQDCRDIPDLQFKIELMVCEPPYVASRLRFHCRPIGRFLGLPIDGRNVSFSENVFYQFRDLKIATVWSVIDKPSLEEQL